MAVLEESLAGPAEGEQPTCMDFLMVPDYTIVTLVNAIAVLRMANRQSGRTLYRWRCLTMDGKPVPSSDGLRLVPDGRLSEPSAGEGEGLAPRMKEPSAGEREGLAPRMKEPSAGEREGLGPRMKEPSAGEREGLAPRKKEPSAGEREGEPLADRHPASDILFVCGGYHPERHCTDALRAALREFDRRGMHIGALCTGARIVADAGLLDDHRCAIHWENAASLREQFPQVQVSSSLFVIDRNRYTCSGGVASIDLMLQLVSSAHGADLAREIAEQFVLERVRTEKDAQRTPLHYLIGAGNQPKLVDVVAMMEANVEEPLTLAELAEQAGITRRQLERLFHRHLHCTPSRYYLDLRLYRGRLMLLQTALPVRAIAERCGFSSTTSFAKRYVEKYGKRPARERAEGD